MMNFSLIVAIDLEHGIGKDDRLPWHLSGELRHFKKITCASDSPEKKNVVIMGRKTWESIPEKFRPLSDRINIILTRSKTYVWPPGHFRANSLEKALSLLETDDLKGKVGAVFIIGGQQIFQKAFKSPYCRKLYVTHINQSFQCDTFFPVFEENFERTGYSSCHNENNITYYFAEYSRK